MLLKGLLIGVFVSAPVGPIGVLCVQRTLNGGKWHGIFTSLGAICSDLLYAIIAIFSMSIVIDFIESHQLLLQIVGTLIVFIFSSSFGCSSLFSYVIITGAISILAA